MPDLDPEDFVRDIRHPLVGSLALYCGDTGVAEELAQEALAKAWLRWDRLDDPKAWTYRTAFNLASSWGRRRSAERRANRRSSAAAVDEPDRADAHAVRAAVAALPDRQRAVVVCRRTRAVEGRLNLRGLWYVSGRGGRRAGSVLPRDP